MFDIIRILPAVVSPIAGIIFAPIFLTFLLVLLIIRIGCHFLFLPEGLSGSLTGAAAAIPLVLYTGIWMEKTLAMGASLVLIHGFPP